MAADYVLPIYVVCDTSLSMLDHVDTLQEGLAELGRVIGADPAAVERTRMCLVGFSESPEILLPLGKVSQIPEMARFAARAGTNFGAAFTFLRDAITRDVFTLQARSLLVCQPIVLFLSDGQPTDPATWPTAFGGLVDPSWVARPRMIAVGVGDVDAATVTHIGTSLTYLGQGRLSPAVSLSEFGQTLIAGIRAAEISGIHDLSTCGPQVGPTLSTSRPEVRGATSGDPLARGGPVDDRADGIGQGVEAPTQGEGFASESDR